MSQDEFIIGLQKLPYRLSMGAPSLPEEVDSADLPSEAMLRKLWRKIAGSADVDERISHDQVRAHSVYLYEIAVDVTYNYLRFPNYPSCSRP